MIQTLKEERQEGNEEHKEDGLNATLDPVENGNQVVATGLASLHVAGGINLANRKLLVESTDVDHCTQVVRSCM